MRSLLLPILAATSLLGAGALANAGVASSGASASGVAAPSHAQRRAAMRQRLFDAIDTDHDGAISRGEYRAWLDRRFAALDGNGDGRVDAGEIADSAAEKARARKRAERFVQRYGAGGSGALSRDAFEAKAMQRFERIAGGADTVTVEQFAAARRREADAPPR